MEKQSIESTTAPFISVEERTRLVGLCARITGRPDAAEDLAQETLLQAWRSENTLRDPAKRTQWLSGIARNMCLRWLRTSGHTAAHQIGLFPTTDQQETDALGLEDILASDDDLALELERKELIELLDRALGLLPAETRAVLVQRYVEEFPLSEIAARLGTNTGAVAMRLQRGKLVLRRILTEDTTQHDIGPYRETRLADRWEQTPLWCYLCGQRHLLGIKDPEEGKFHLRCPNCTPEPDEGLSTNRLDELKGLKGYKALSKRLSVICDYYYRNALRDSAATCSTCGHLVPTHILCREEVPQWVWQRLELRWTWPRTHDDKVVATFCEHCRNSWMSPLTSLALSLPQARSFSQAHPRIRTLPRQELEVDGRAAILTRFESVNESAQLAVVSDSETFSVLRVYGG